jgi:hypothetical protein
MNDDDGDLLEAVVGINNFVDHAQRKTEEKAEFRKIKIDIERDLSSLKRTLQSKKDSLEKETFFKLEDQIKAMETKVTRISDLEEMKESQEEVNGISDEIQGL